MQEIAEVTTPSMQIPRNAAIVTEKAENHGVEDYPNGGIGLITNRDAYRVSKRLEVKVAAFKQD